MMLFAEQAKREKLEALEYIKAYLKFKGVSNSEDDQIRKLLGQSLSFK